MAGKSVLVIDTPECCVDCDLMYDYLYCSANQEERNMTQMEEGRPKGRPLRPLPSFKAVDLNDTRNVVMFCHGWNTCLAEITGETE